MYDISILICTFKHRKQPRNIVKMLDTFTKILNFNIELVHCPESPTAKSYITPFAKCVLTLTGQL